MIWQGDKKRGKAGRVKRMIKQEEWARRQGREGKTKSYGTEAKQEA